MAIKQADRLGKLQLPAGAAEKFAKDRTFASWSQEGFELAKTVAYQAADGGGILKHVVIQTGEPFPEDAPEAGAKYAEKAHAARRRAGRFGWPAAWRSGCMSC